MVQDEIALQGPSTLKVSDVIAEYLEFRGIRHIFGIIGSGNASLFDAIARRGFTQIVYVHHEQAAVMAMNTYFRVRGEVSATLLTTGAGSTNGVTGVVDAWMDSIPGVIISGNENSKFTNPSNPLRIWGIQGYDSPGMVRTVTKYADRILDPRDALSKIQAAFWHSTHGRPGPTWLDVPMNIQQSTVERKDLHPFQAPAPFKENSVHNSVPIVTNPKDAAGIIAKKLLSAKRPVFWLGHGIRLAGATDLIPLLLEKFPVPTLVSWAGIDLIDSNHPLVFGRAGIYGQRAANFVLQNSDLVICIGTRLAIPQIGYELSELARAAEFIVIDIDPDEAVKHSSRVTCPIVSDAGEVIRSILDEHPVPAASEWVAQCEDYRRRYPWVGPEHSEKDGFINSYAFMEKLVEHFKSDQVIVTDMGTALLSGHQVLKTKHGQRLMTSTGLGEMGYGLPGAIGASFARNRGEVMCLNCDGGMMMNLQELQTMVHYRLPIKLFIFNNDGYLMIKHTQKALYSGRYVGVDAESGVTCPDYTKLAKAFGIPSFQIRTWNDFHALIPEVQTASGPIICEVFMSPEQLFVPKLSLAPAGGGVIVSPPLEDLSPLLPREELKKNMIIGMHPKSEKLNS